MSDSSYNSSAARSSGLGLTRTNILGPGPDSNKPGSRRGIQGISLTPARSITTAGISLSSGRPQREQYQSVYTSRLGGSLTNSAPNINNLSALGSRQSSDTLGESFTPRRANISSLRLTPRRASADPRSNKLEQINDENREERVSEFGRRGSDIAGNTFNRNLDSEETGHKKTAVNLSRTHSDIEYSRRLRNKASRNSETYSPRSPIGGSNGSSDGVKPDSGYNSPRHTEFTYTGRPSSDSITSDSPLPGNSASYQSNLSEKVDDGNVDNLDTVDSQYEALKNTLKVRYDSGYLSPRYEAKVDNQVQPDKAADPDEQNHNKIQSLSVIDNLSGTKGSRQYSGKLDNAVAEAISKDSDKVYKDFEGYTKSSVSETRESKQRPASCGSILESTPENSVFTTNLNGSGSIKEAANFSEMSAFRGEQGKAKKALKPVNADLSDSPIPQPRTRRRLTKRTSFKRVEEDEYIGFASLPEQVHRKAVRRGFEFTLMVVGETGLGKSTLINSLFLTDLYKDRKFSNTEERIQKTVDLEKKELEIEERGVKLKLTIVDTPGFNDAVNAEESWKPIVNYVDTQFDAYFKAESGLNRKNIKDTRVHCCLYFISPYGHGLRPVDVLVMKKLHNKVNIVPLIAKSDILTKQECKRLKEKITDEIEKHRIHIYQFPDCDSDEDDEFKQQDKELKASIPFAVVGSNTVVEAPGGKKIRGRMYPWGIVEVENPKHCDFIRLRQMLISTHMQDLKDVTCDIHYENYRAEHISEQMGTQRRDRNKLKRDSTPNMEAVLETDLLLQQKEAEIQRMREMMRQMEAKIRSQNSPQMNGRVGNV